GCRGAAVSQLMPTAAPSSRPNPSMGPSGKWSAAGPRQFIASKPANRNSGCKTHHLRLHEAFKVLVAHPDYLRVRAGVEGDLLVVGQGLGDIDLHPVQIAERRHRARFAIGKGLFELLLDCEL